ncbi:hypothetical protein AYI69_g3309 [Smittium culicis]|uniref:Uncharacterized protein n=1 Tax=Smittium culicis TaxID=133412 RepID=A0A1R1YKE1_9FUNG|nr:hypothetical protein AYI69_g3309 [Smittium culicis]
MIQNLKEENKFLKEQLEIQTKRIDNLPHLSKKAEILSNKPASTRNSNPAAPTAPPITFNIGPASLPVQKVEALSTNKLSYSEIARSQTKNAKDAIKLTLSIRRLVGSKPFNRDSRS